jgi:hypothetical protein
MRSKILRFLGRMLAYHYHESGKMLDWYAWGSLTLSSTFIVLVFLIPVFYTAFKHYGVDFDVKSQMRAASFVVALVFFLLVRVILFIIRVPLIAQCHIELERSSERDLKRGFMRIGIATFVIALVMSFLTALGAELVL